MFTCTKSQPKSVRTELCSSTLIISDQAFGFTSQELATRWPSIVLDIGTMIVADFWILRWFVRLRSSFLSRRTFTLLILLYRLRPAMRHQLRAEDTWHFENFKHKEGGMPFFPVRLVFPPFSPFTVSAGTDSDFLSGPRTPLGRSPSPSSYLGREERRSRQIRGVRCRDQAARDDRVR
jgi:hypothetical protein